ncbi:MAG: mercury(II) reductase [Actinomycetota bacterium]
MHTYDLAVIGSGGAGFAAAIRATSLGLRVVMVERGTVGGTCVNTGCVPSKALLAAAEARHAALAQRFPGIATSADDVDMAALVAGKDGLVTDLRAEKYLDLIAEYGWELRTGSATFTGTAEEPVLQVTTPEGTVERLDAEHYLVATGSTPWAPPINGLDEVGYLTSTTAMELARVPDSLLVVGGNFIGLEQGQLFARLGSTVTVLEALDRLAPTEEPEASAAIAGVFADEGIAVVTGAQVTAVRRDPATGEVSATAVVNGRSQEFRAGEILVATGRRPVTEGLNLDEVGVKRGDRGEVVVEPTLRSSNPRIWAAGDVTGHPQFVYVAGAHGALVVDNAFSGADRPVDYHHLPRVTFTTPNLAAVGLTDEQANAAGIRCECRVLPLDYVPRALINRDTRGLVKIVADADTGRIVGVSAVAQGAGELAAAATYVLAAGMTVEQLANLWCPYLTMTEGLKIAAQSFTTDVSKLSCCAS